MKTLFLLILLLFFICSSTGRPEGIKFDLKQQSSSMHNEVDIKTKKKGRELTAGVKAVYQQDYRDPGSNPAHDPPPPGRSGGKSGNNY